MNPPAPLPRTLSTPAHRKITPMTMRASPTKPRYLPEMYTLHLQCSSGFAVAATRRRGYVASGTARTADRIVSPVAGP